MEQSIAVLEEGQPHLRQMAIFPEQHTAPELSCAVVHVKLDGMRLERPRQWGACWLGMMLWEALQLDEFWHPRLGRTREGTEWLHVLKTMALYRLIDLGPARPGQTKLNPCCLGIIIPGYSVFQP